MARKKLKKGGKKRGAVAKSGPANPPPFRAITTVRKTFRYKVSTACVSFAPTEAQLLAMPGTMCTVVNTTVVAQQISVKIHKISIWGPPPTQGSTSTVSVRWLGVAAAAANFHAAMNGVEDTSTNPAHAPRIVARPPPGSSAAFWLSADNSGTDYVLALDAPAGSIIDFDVEFNHGMPPAVGAFTFAVSTGTLGVNYWLSFVPIGGGGGTGYIIPTTLATTI